MREEEFLRLNEAMAIRALLDQVYAIERVWESDVARAQALGELFALLQWAKLHRSPLVQKLSELSHRIPSSPSYHQFMSLIVPVERAHGRMISDADILIDSVDHGPEASVSPKNMPAILVLDNIRSAFNVGSLLRLADCMGLEKVYLCGYTALPDQDKVAKAALGAERKVVWEWVPHTLSCIQALQNQGVPVFALETAQGAATLEAFKFPQQRLALVCGNERYGLEPSLLKACTQTLEIPCWGYKNSLNVAVSVGMLTYEVRRQWLSQGFLAH